LSRHRMLAAGNRKTAESGKLAFSFPTLSGMTHGYSMKRL
jgi:hypothetical protein